MSKKTRDNKEPPRGKPTVRPAHAPGSKKQVTKAPSASSEHGRSKRAGDGWYYGKRAVFRFVSIFVLLMALFHVACVTPLFREGVFPLYLRFNAQVAGAMLAVFEDELTVTDQSIHSPRFSLTVERGCDAIEPSALFIAGVLAFPASLLAKLPGILIGTLCLMVLNLARIFSLYYVGVYWPGAFHVMHVDVWQALFIFLAILFWTLWAVRASHGNKLKINALFAGH